jgi:hypothetical protein
MCLCQFALAAKNKKMKKYFLFFIILLFLVGCVVKPEVSSFEECIAAGNPAMESYPRQCRHGALTFTEVIEEESGEFPTGIAGQVKARDIAKSSDCMKEGTLKSSFVHNEVTKTWWFDMDVEKEGCNPACVVSEETFTAEINWRCTGLIPE